MGRKKSPRAGLQGDGRTHATWRQLPANFEHRRHHPDGRLSRLSRHIHRIQLSLGFSFPTGIDDATFNDFILPTGLRRNIRGFYGMQLGTGTFDILPGVIYAGYLGPWSWGLSYRGRL